MGMFDYVTGVKIPCPKCGKILDDFQSKDLECVLKEVVFCWVDCFYTMCDCGTWVEYKIKQEFRNTRFRKELTLDDYELVE